MTKEELEKVKGFVVAIDGPAGVGKSSIANMVAKRLGFYFLNSGNYYRAITYKLIEKDLDYKNEKAVLELANNLKLEIINERMHVNNLDVEDKLHKEEISAIVAQVSAIVELRYLVNKQLRKLSENGMNIV